MKNALLIFVRKRLSRVCLISSGNTLTVDDSVHVLFTDIVGQ